MKNVIAIDVGGTFIKHGIVSEDGDLLISSKSITNKNSFEVFIGSLYKIIELILKTIE